MRHLSLVLLVVSSCSAREILTLRNGFTLEARSHTVRNGILLVDAGSGTVEFPESEVAEVKVLGESAQVVAAPTPVQEDTHPEALLWQAASNQGLPPELVHSVAKIESGLRPNAVSPVGARGLMQLMPGTAAALNVAADIPAQNAQGGAAYLRQLLLQYRGNAALALAAYNSGPGAVAHYGGVPPYAETRRYVLRVLKELAAEQRKKH